MKKKMRILFAAGLLLAAAGIGICSFAGYGASSDALLAMEGSRHESRAEVFVPRQICGGLVFYPGGLVDHRAYAPLMQMLSDRGILCLLLEMPLDLAVLDMHAADGLAALYPDVEHWLIGGHSLGGAMAASHLEAHADEYDGLVLLGAYSTADLSRTDLKVLSIYGTQDGVLNREKYDECLKHYPRHFEEVLIEGGCHAYFGDYGMQKGDGMPSISREEQLRVTADAIARMFQ